MPATHPLPPAADSRHGPWLCTYTGRRLYPWDCRPDDFDPLDIAHALANTCRFNGHCRTFYSVAQHSVAVADHLDAAEPLLRLWGLLHDAAEAILGDAIRPLKSLLCFRRPSDGWPGGHPLPWNALEGAIGAGIFRRFGLIGGPPPAVHWADEAALATEIRDLMPAVLAAAWFDQPQIDRRAAPWPEPTRPLAPAAAEELFLNRLCELTPPEDLRPWTP